VIGKGDGINTLSTILIFEGTHESVKISDNVEEEMIFYYKKTGNKIPHAMLFFAIDDISEKKSWYGIETYTLFI